MSSITEKRHRPPWTTILSPSSRIKYPNILAIHKVYSGTHALIYSPPLRPCLLPAVDRSRFPQRHVHCGQNEGSPDAHPHPNPVVKNMALERLRVQLHLYFLLSLNKEVRASFKISVSSNVKWEKGAGAQNCHEDRDNAPGMSGTGPAWRTSARWLPAATASTEKPSAHCLRLRDYGFGN